MEEEEFEGERSDVVIFTEKFKISGQIYLLSNARLTDFMIDAKEFIAVTNARVMDREEKVLFEASFLNVNKNSVVIISPRECVNCGQSRGPEK